MGGPPAPRRGYVDCMSRLVKWVASNFVSSPTVLLHRQAHRGAPLRLPDLPGVLHHHPRKEEDPRPLLRHLLVDVRLVRNL